MSSSIEKKLAEYRMVKVIENQVMDDWVMQQTLETVCSRVYEWMWMNGKCEWNGSEWIPRVMMLQLTFNVLKTLELIKCFQIKLNKNKREPSLWFTGNIKYMRKWTTGHRAFAKEIHTSAYKCLTTQWHA